MVRERRERRDRTEAEASYQQLCRLRGEGCLLGLGEGGGAGLTGVV